MKINLGTLTMTSPAFEHGGRMPDKHSSGGEGVSPELSWSGVPDGTRSFALVSHDPDAPLVDGFTHWVIYGIPADATQLFEGATEGFVAGKNGAGGSDWIPLGPPPGHGVHFYYFTVYALDSDLGLEPGLDRAQLREKIDEHIIAQARIVGTFSND